MKIVIPKTHSIIRVGYSKISLGSWFHGLIDRDTNISLMHLFSREIVVNNNLFRLPIK